MLDINNLSNVKFKQFYIAMTNRCNLRCRMCTTTTHPHELEEELLLGQWEDILENILRFEVESVGFGGGEPLIRKQDLVYLVKKVASNGVVVNIITNATLLTASFLEDIIQYKEKVIFLLSLDGLQKENDSVRGEGVFQKVIEATKILQRFDWTFYITSVLMPENFFGYVDFLTFIIKHYPETYLDIQPVIPHNEVYYKRERFELDNSQVKSLLNIISFLYNNENKIKLCRPLRIINRYWDYFTNSLYSENQCKMGTGSFNINLRGNIWICGKELNYPLHKYKLEDILKNSEYTTEMKRVQDCKSPCLAGLVI